MFANFELSSVGLVETDVKPKRTRTDLGCLPCRRKKKKCDLSKPSCLRCRKSTGRVVCEWPKHASASPPPDDEAAQTSVTPDRELTPPPPTIPEDPSGGTSAVVSRNKSRADYTGLQSYSDTQVWKPPNPQLGNGITVKLPAAVKKITPGLSSSDLIQLTAAFDRAVISRDDNTMKRPASSLSLPLCLNHPALMHAWLCCSTVFVAGRQKGGLQRALMHYQAAVTDLATAIGGTGTSSPEWKLATVLLLHTFESMGPGDGSPASIRIAHLNGAHNLVRMSMMHRAPTSTHELLLLEAYVYRTITNRLFQPFPTLPYTHISHLYTSMCSPGSPRSSMTESWRTSPWIGMSAHLFDYIFKLSYLRSHVPLSGENLVECLSISNKLSQWRPPISSPEDLFDLDSKTADIFMLKTLLLAKSYWYATSFLCHKILNPDTGPLDPQLHALQRQGNKVLLQLVEMQAITAAVLWPTLVLGTGAVNRDEQADFERILANCMGKAGQGGIGRVRRFMERSWVGPTDTEAGFLGSDALLRQDLLEQVFF